MRLKDTSLFTKVINVDIDYEELMDSDDNRDRNEQKQCETCFRYFNSQFKLQSHLNAPHRCQVCCKKFSSRVRLSECRSNSIIEVHVY